MYISYNFLNKSVINFHFNKHINVLKIFYGILGYDMSPFIRRYSKYLNEKALSYRTVAFDFCKVKRR